MPNLVGTVEWSLLGKLGRILSQATDLRGPQPKLHKIDYNKMIESELREICCDIHRCDQQALESTDHQHCHEELSRLCASLEARADTVHPRVDDDRNPYPRLHSLIAQVDGTTGSFDIMSGPHRTLFVLPTAKPELERFLKTVEACRKALDCIETIGGMEERFQPLQETTGKHAKKARPWYRGRARQRAQEALGTIFSPCTCGSSRQVLLEVSENQSHSELLPLCLILSWPGSERFLTQFAGQAPTPSIRDVCAEIHQTTASNIFLVENRQLLNDQDDSSFLKRGISSSRTLRELIEKRAFRECRLDNILGKDPSELFTTDDKRRLTLKLGFCLMDFFDTEFSADKISLNSPHMDRKDENLYLTFTSKPSNAADLFQFQSGSPTMLHFANLLLEIESGEHSRLTINPESTANRQVQATLFDALDRLDKRVEKDLVHPSIVEAIRGCVTFCINIKQSQDLTGNDSRLRKKLYKKVVSKLQLAQKPEKTGEKRKRSTSPGSSAPSAVYQQVTGNDFELPNDLLSKQKALSKNQITQEKVSKKKKKNSVRESAAIAETRGRSSLLSGKPECMSSTRSDLPANVQLFDERRYTIQESDERVAKCVEFMREADCFYDGHIDKPGASSSQRRIRVAVLDTGVDLNNMYWASVKVLRKNGDIPIKDVKSFVGEPELDTYGHGTDVAALISKIAPEADLYIAKISSGQETRGSDQIVEAIRWAEEKRVHIINMSFGLPKGSKRVEDAIDEATKKGIIFIAAASNVGGHGPRAFPAKLERVICMHATDGDGDKSSMNPSPDKERYLDHFSTLGVGIESVFHEPEAQDQAVYLEGTSYATPVAAGMAVNILIFVQYFLAENYRKEAFSWRGMRNIFRAVAHKRGDGYQFMAPWHHFRVKGSSTEDMTYAIKSYLTYDMS